jgi:hypothetical protein
MISRIPAAGNRDFTIRTFLYPEFFGKNKKIWNLFFPLDGRGSDPFPAFEWDTESSRSNINALIP